MNEMIILFIALGALGIVCLALFTFLLLLKKKIRELETTLFVTIEDTAPIEINFYWSLKKSLQENEMFEEMTFLDDKIKEKFGREFINPIPLNQFMRMVVHDEDY